MFVAGEAPGDARRARGLATRERLLDAARTVFMAEGYAAASLDRIAACAGISKMTIYRKFADKEELFLATINQHCAQIYDVAEHSPAANHDEARVALTDFGWVFARTIIAPDVLHLYRMLLGEMSRFPQLGAHFYDVAPARSLAVIERILSGIMQGEECRQRARAFMHMVMGDCHQRLMLGKSTQDEAEAALGAQIDAAVHMVLAV